MIRVVIITVIVTGLLVGGGVYYWQKTKAENEKNKLQTQIQRLQGQLSSLENRIGEQPYLLLGRVEEQNKVANLREHVGVFYKGEEDGPSVVILKSRKWEKVLCDVSPSYPTVSPDKKRIAYISPFGWEELGELYIYDLSTDSNKVVIKRNDLLKQYTPKVVSWLDDRYLLVIIGFAYGTITVGGDLYIFDTLTKSLNLCIKCGKRQEIKNINKDGEKIILEFVNFKKGGMEYTIEQKSVKYEDVILKAKKIE